MKSTGWSLRTSWPLALAGAALALSLSAPSGAGAQQAGGSELFAVTAPGQGQGSNVLYVVDPQGLRLAVYEHRVGGGKGALRLTAVRSLENDLRYEEWPDPKRQVQAPSVRDMRPK